MKAKLVKETLLGPERQREREPDAPERETITKPRTRPTTKPGRPSPIPIHRPSVTPKPKAETTPKVSLNKLVRRYKRAIEK